MSAPIYLISGPPAAGKTTLAAALLAHHPCGFHLEVDRLRTWVVRGVAESVPWTDETERQFQVAEEAACDVALRYQAAGFAVAFDHCRNLARLEGLVRRRLNHVAVLKLCLLPPLEVNLARNLARTNKDFDPAVLDETIRFVNQRMRAEPVPEGWRVLDPAASTPEELAAQVLAAHPPEPIRPNSSRTKP